MLRACTLLFAGYWSAGALPIAADVVVFRRGAKEITVEGNVLKQDGVGTILFEGRDQQQYLVPLSDRVRWETSDDTVPLWTKSELKAQLEKEYGRGFRVAESGGYLIVHSCSPEHAREAGQLLNRTQVVFARYFSTQGNFKLEKPRQPLVAVVFETREQYLEHVSVYLGPQAKMSVGLYIPPVNRIFMYNAFGGKGSERVGAALRVNPALARGMAAQLVGQNIMTIVHEAVHQAAFNTGFHNRSVIDNPVWLVEGMAMFFETPDLDAAGGWKGGRTVNPDRARRFEEILPGLPRGFLARMLVEDGMFRDPAAASDAYALAWTLTFYLLKTQNKAYMEYLKLVNARPQLTHYARKERLADFEEAFKKTPDKLESDFRRTILRLLENCRK